jgi:hypothetical protein
MKIPTTPLKQLPPPPRDGWHYDNYFIAQLAKFKENAQSKLVGA